jgi:hypothetical protein
VDQHHFEPAGITTPVATLLIDGEDLFAACAPNGFVGFDPDQLLDSAQPLLPTEPPRRVAIYKCSCGEPGCGVVAPVISTTGIEVRWTDFRDFTGVFMGPLAEDEEEEEDGRTLSVEELSFDSTQYANEVGRATTDLSWESPTRATARLLKVMLESESATLTDFGLATDWVAPAHHHEPNISVSFRDLDHRYVERPRSRVVVTLSAEPGSPEDRAAEMLTRLLSAAPDQWTSSFPHAL